MKTPIIFRAGKRIYLGPVLKEDLPILTTWINDPEIGQFLQVYLPTTVEDEEKWFSGLSDKKPNEGIQKEHRYRNGRRVDCYLLAVFKRNFLPLWKKYKKDFLNKK
jgi:hypothetical protein